MSFTININYLEPDRGGAGSVLIVSSCFLLSDDLFEAAGDWSRVCQITSETSFTARVHPVSTMRADATTTTTTTTEIA